MTDTPYPPPHREAEADKKASAARKKAERDALLAEEEASQRSTPKKANAKSAPKKSKGTLDLSHLDTPNDDDDDKPAPTLNATGIDNALDALSLTTSDPSTQKTDRHPERRFKAAYAAFEARRLDEIATEHPGLRKQQRVDICRKDFERSEENPFNQAGVVGWDASKEEVREVRERVRAGVEGRLGEKSS